LIYSASYKRILGIIVLNIFVCLNLYPQAPSFIWMSGSETSRQPGVYGTKGVGSMDNTPGARYNYGSLTDKEGNFWLFGGYGVDEGGNLGQLSDLWKFVVNSGEWVWIHGGNTTFEKGHYIEIGVSHPNNEPGSRSGSPCWSDSSDNLWMFGGWSQEYARAVNDLWKFDIVKGEWTCVSIDKSANYGLKGISSPANIPGSRHHAITWTDSLDHFWMFGGRGFVEVEYSTVLGFLNDLWMFNKETYEWTWVGGSNEQNQNGSFGSLGIANETNIPPSRMFATGWQDSEGKIWVFGGMGPKEEEIATFINDFWQYNPVTNLWTWMGGSKEIGKPGNYGSKGVGSTNNIPGARSGAIGWTDLSGNLWLFSGSGATGEGPIEPGHAYSLNDLWMFEPSSGNWSWHAGDTIQVQDWAYGTKGIENFNNKPPGRDRSTGWSDKGGNLWFFGGLTFLADATGVTNDMWKIAIGENITYQGTEPNTAPDLETKLPGEEGEIYQGEIPNVITPNGDGFNDLFVIPKIDRYPENRLTILNRHGNKIIEIAGYNNTWDADELISGLYYYYLYLSPNNDIQRGWLQILR
jgi:gliding motility-associated-like protein